MIAWLWAAFTLFWGAFTAAVFLSQGLFGLVPLTFVWIGLFGWLRAIGVLRMRGTHATSSLLTKDGRPIENHPLQLEKDAPARLSNALFVGLFWNAIVAVFVATAIAGHVNGQPDWLLTFFVGPFVIVGIFLLGLIGWRLLECRVPRPVLTLSQSILTIGSSVQLSWRFRQSVARVRRLSVVLTGKEIANFYRGNQPQREQHEFLHERLVDVSDGLKEGEVEVHVPGDKMHSFESDNHQVSWELEVSCEVAGLPDARDRYQVLVLPAGSAAWLS